MSDERDEAWHVAAARALWDLYHELLGRPPDPDGAGAYSFRQRELGWTWEDVAADIRQSAEYLEKHPDLAPVVVGRWRGNFLYPAEFFFGPACCAFSPEKRAAYFAHLRARGDTHVLINAEQADWGPSRGHPEYTAGGFDAYAGAGMAHLVAVLLEARSYGLTPLVGVVDQPSLLVLSLPELIARSRNLVEATAEHACLYMLSWEIDEVWGSGDEREPNIRQWIAKVDWRGRDVGIHYADGLRGGLVFYGSLPPFAVRLMQWHAALSLDEVAEHAALIADVAARTGTKVCAFEHSSSLNQSPTRSLAECVTRARVAMDEFRKFPLTDEQIGSLNG